jgi:3-oxoacyl-[acyl-carrier protein] reductase
MVLPVAIVSATLLGWSSGWSQPQVARAFRSPAVLMDAATPRGVAIVTGGSGGIGLACCHRLAARGSNIVIAYGGNHDLAERARAQLVDAHGVEVRTVAGDLTKDQSRDETVAAVFEAVDELGGNVSAFVHAAGFFHNELLQNHFDGAAETFEVYDAYQSIYPKAFVAFAEGALKRMDRGGRLVAITNPGCNAVQTPRVGYDMPGQGKATMEFVVRMYAMRVAKRGICVNAVSPAYTDTPEWDKARLAMGRGDIEKGRELLDAKMLSRSPVARWAAPDEIAQAVDFLCAEQSGLITGATIPVDGGLHLV